MTTAIQLSTDNEVTIFDLRDDGAHLQELITIPFEISVLNGPCITHEDHITVGIAFGGDAVELHCPHNEIATALRNMFIFPDGCIHGVAIVMACDWGHNNLDVPIWLIDLVRAIELSLKEAFKYHQKPRLG